MHTDEHRCTPTHADARSASLLGAPTGHALRFISRVGYLDTGAPVDLRLSYGRSDDHGFCQRNEA